MNTKLTSVALAAVVSMVVPLPTMAHHAVQASVDIDREISLKARLTRIHWVNPHTWMEFEYTDETGEVTKYTVESLGINALRRAGISSKSALHVGDMYDITFFPNRNNTPGGFMFEMILPDGRSLNVTNLDPSFVAMPTGSKPAQ